MTDTTSTPEAPSRQSLTAPILLVLIVCGMAATTNAQVFALLLSPMAEDLGVSVARLGGLRAIEEVVAIATGLALAPYIDRTSRKRLLLAGLALMAIAALIATSSSTQPRLVAYFVIDGVSKILLFATVLAMPGDLTSGHSLDRALGFVIGSFALSGFTVIPLAGWVAAEATWREGYLVAVAMAVVGFALTAWLVPNVAPSAGPHGSPLGHLGTLIRFPGLALALGGALMRFMLFSSVLTYTGAFLIDEHGVSVGRAGLYFSLGAGTFLIASVCSGFMLRLVGASRALVAGGLIGATLVLFAYSVPSDSPLAIAGVALLLAVALMGVHENASTGLLLRLSREQRGATMSLNELCAAAGSLLGIGLGAVALRELGYPGVGLVLGAGGALAALLTLQAIRVANAQALAASRVS